MKLSTKILTVFLAALLINIGIIFFGLTSVLDNLSSMLMKKQAETLAQFLQHRIVENSKTGLADNIGSIISSDFIIAKHISDESRTFELKKILLIKRDYSVLIGYPDSETGTSYAAHEDIRETFTAQKKETVIETVKGQDGKEETYIDVVSFLTFSDGSPYVLEVKLDFAKSVALLEKQYTVIEIGAISIAMLILVALLGVLLYIMRRTAVNPVIRVTHAMEKVGHGDLDVHLPERSGDEFGMLARRFNEMVSGLREKMQLYKYVSQGTIEAAKAKAVLGADEHATIRKEIVVFFSDIRGFTAFSESRDPRDIVDVLNRILTIQSAIIKKHGGDIDKFVGDEVMAVFPDSVSAVAASLEIQKEIFMRASEINSLHIGIGIHKGEVVQGDIGSDDQRDYTVIGDSVNTAARLQAAAKGDEILISEIIAAESEMKTLFQMVYKGSLKLKGKEILIKTYNVDGRIAPR
jgi:class 3 adenylate cyclase